MISRLYNRALRFLWGFGLACLVCLPQVIALVACFVVFVLLCAGAAYVAWRWI